VRLAEGASSCSDGGQMFHGGACVCVRWVSEWLDRGGIVALVL